MQDPVLQTAHSTRPRRPLPRSGLRVLGALALLGSLASCGPDYDVVLYCAHDQVHAEPLVKRFEEESGLRVLAEYDIEAHKTVGLVERIRQEKNRPRCDVFWNNEPGHTIALADEDLLASYDSPNAKAIPAFLRDARSRWTGFAARARIFIVNTDLVPDPSVLTSMHDLTDPKWKGKCGMAKPLTGTTLTHFASLRFHMDEADFDAYVEALEANDVLLTRGNAHLKTLVASGELAFGWTDTDDFNVARLEGAPVVAVYPDQGEDQMGTMVIPNTVAILAEAPNPEAAKTLVDYILSPEIEEAMAASRSAQIPVRPDVPRPDHVRSTKDFKVMPVDFPEVGETLQDAFLDFQDRFDW